MVSISPVLKSNKRRQFSSRWLAAVLMLFASGLAQAGEFVVHGVSTRLHDNVYRLDADIEYRFSNRALRALESGLPLTIRVLVEIERQRSWWLDEHVASLEQRYELRYHAFSRRFLVRNLNSGAGESFPSLDTAILGLGTIRDLPLLDRELIAAGERYQGLLMASLDIEYLPLPLRPLAYVSPSWRLDSDWYEWSLAP